MSNRNIGGDSADKSYRYKRPQLVTKVEGRGNGIKTVLVNMTEIAKALTCPPSYPTKFLGFTLGTQSKYTESTDRAVINGRHDQPDLEKILDKFIDLYVLCPNCKYPETRMSCKKSRILVDCAACGYNGELKHVNKMQAFILKQPPNSKKDGGKEKDKKRKKKDKKKKDKKEKTAEAVGSEDVEAVAEEIKEIKLTSDTSKEAQARRRREEFAESGDISAKSKKIMSTKPGETASPGEMLKRLFAGDSKPRTKQVLDELDRIALARGLDDAAKMKILLEGVLDLSVPKNVAGQFKTHKKIFKKAVKGGPSHPTLLLLCIEELVGVIEPKLMSRTPIILNQIYDLDILDEKTILDWAMSPPESSYLVPKQTAGDIRNAATPFITWLQEDSDDDSDSASSED